jgi:hypothetical protein
MISERDYMKRRSGEESDADAVTPPTTNVPRRTADSFDIFAGVEKQALTPQTPPTKVSDDSKTGNSARTVVSSAALAGGQPELPLNRLPAKHPRFFWYAAAAILGIIICILLGGKL